MALTLKDLAEVMHREAAQRMKEELEKPSDLKREAEEIAKRLKKQHNIDRIRRELDRNAKTAQYWYSEEGITSFNLPQFKAIKVNPKQMRFFIGDKINVPLEYVADYILKQAPLNLEPVDDTIEDVTFN